MNMGYNIQEYKKTENEYVKGIETSHGRISLVFDVILENIEKLKKNHPKTDFISFGKVLNGITILAKSLDMEKGGELSEQLLELYDYSSRQMKSYLEDKKIKRIEDVKSIFITLNDGWTSIDPVE